MTDKELYTGISEKNNNAFLYLYNHQIDAIKSMVRKNSGTEADALDIFQEGMIALWINIQKEKYSLDGNVKLSTYLYSICRNLWLKKLRGTKKIVSFDDYNEKAVAEEDILDTNYEKVKKLERNFSQLGEKCKSILHLFYYKKTSLREIAAQFNYEEKTAKNEKYRCMKRLRAMYN